MPGSSALFLGSHGFRAQEELRNVDHEFMRRRIGALQEAELALVAPIDEICQVSLSEFLRVAVGFVIDVIEQAGVIGTQWQTQAAAMAYVDLADEFVVEV